MPIQILDASTISKIAAGEVVENPASVAKELIENSLDAGARHISVELKDGGAGYLRVVDDGCGIPPEQLRLAFENHATSKLRTADDLVSVSTMGFRGEALPSIASVAKIEMSTRVRGAASGAKICVTGGRVESIGETGCPEGTSFTVKDLFFNVPVRLSFLKSAPKESAAVVDAVIKLALANPDVAFKVNNGGKVALRTPGDGELRHAIMAVYDRKTAQLMSELDSFEGSMRISGLVGVGECAKSTRSHQFFFVNGRCIRSALLSQALETACRGRVMIGRFPMCALNIDIPATMVDVNVHPSKLEVRFKDEAYVFSAASVIIERAFSGDNMLTAAPPVDETPPPPVDIRQFGPEASSTNPDVSASEAAARSENPGSLEIDPDVAAMLDGQSKAPVNPGAASKPAQTSDGTANVSLMDAIASAYNRTSSKPAPSGAPRADDTHASNISYLPYDNRQTQPAQPSEQTGFWRDAAEKMQQRACPAESPVQNVEQVEFPKTGPEFKLIGSAFDTYIFVQLGESMYIIDQHAAHERILYERFMKQWDAGVISQPMLVPSIITVTQSEKQQIMDNIDLLRGIGFEIDEFGERDIQVRAVPQILGEPDMTPFFLNSIQELKRLKNAPLEQKRDAVIQSACKHAIKGGDPLTRPEIESLLQLMRETGAPPTCPHGRPVIIELPRSELEKRFGRIV